MNLQMHFHEGISIVTVYSEQRQRVNNNLQRGEKKREGEKKWAKICSLIPKKE